MKKLTKNQKEFVLQYFFKNEYFAGWKGIAEKLLDNGKCIVAGEGCIWKGGVGNFIKTEETEEAYDCTLYTFDLKQFVLSQWFIDIQNSYLQELNTQKNELEQKYNEIIML